LNAFTRRISGVLAAAAENAAEVDRAGRFPAEALAALRAARLLGSMVPRSLGGEGASLEETMEACQALGASCGASGMILAMHQIQVACLVAHAGHHPWHQALLRRIAEEQLLLASVTSESTTGGNMRTSDCTPVLEGERFRIVKEGPTVSYASEADVLLVTARRAEDAQRSDQKLIAVLRGDADIAVVGHWDTMGMRGTCSHAVNLRAEGESCQILETGFGEIAERTMVPVSHLLWGSVWTGIASDAQARARAWLRRSMRQGGSTAHPGAHHLTEMSGLLHSMQARLRDAAAGFEAGRAADGEGSPSQAAAINLLKIDLSETALRVALLAMRVCGMAGYRNGTEFSVGRHLRDLQSAPLMINNDRIAADTATLLVAQRSPFLQV